MKKSKKIIIILGTIIVLAAIAVGIYFLFFKTAECPGEEVTNNPQLNGDPYGVTVKKPVLYLYPETTTNVKVNFAKEDLLTITYPKFINEWEVTVDNKGNIYDNDGKYYYGLYWEEKISKKDEFTTGFYVESNEAIDFLEEKLSLIGLNDRERNEFIMYWLPVLEGNEKSLVYFELTEEREHNNQIIIDPKPDSLLRLVMHVKKVDKKVDIKEEQLKPFNRQGFAAVEWGGIEY